MSSQNDTEVRAPILEKCPFCGYVNIFLKYQGGKNEPTN